MKRKISTLLLLAALCLALAGCRARITERTDPALQGEDGVAIQAAGEARRDAGEAVPDPEENGEIGETMKENPDASRKEYDMNAGAEIAAEASPTVYGAGEGGGAANPAAEGPAAAQVREAAERDALRTVTVPDAEQLRVSPDAESADSAQTYYDALLRQRLGTLFECKKLYAYWEGTAELTTIHKTSPEHALLLDSGLYDVSSRLLPENLRVDAGWVTRKNPGLIVKLVEDASLLNASSVAALGSRPGWDALDAVRAGRVLLLSASLLDAPCTRTAARLIIAKAAYPELFADVEPAEALAELTREGLGAAITEPCFYLP